MSKLGYVLGGALAGAIGTAIAAYAVDACSSSSTGASQELDTDAPDSVVEGDGESSTAPFAGSASEESCTA